MTNLMGPRARHQTRQNGHTISGTEAGETTSYSPTPIHDKTRSSTAKDTLLSGQQKQWTGTHAAVPSAFTTTRPGSQPCTISPKSKDIGKLGFRLTASVAYGQHGGCWDKIIPL